MRLPNAGFLSSLLVLLGALGACSSPTPTLAPTPTPDALHIAKTALLYEQAARVRDQFLQDIESCRFLIEAAESEDIGGPFFGTNEGGGFRIRIGAYRDKDGSWIGPASSGAFGIANRDNRRQRWQDRNFSHAARDFAPAVFFPTRYDTFVSEEPQGSYAGESMYLGKAAMRYEMHFIDEDAAMIKVSDYVTENPYIFNRKTYRILSDGERRLVHQQVQSNFTLYNCTDGENHDAAIETAWKDLFRQTKIAYDSLRDRISTGCFGGYSHEIARFSPLAGTESTNTYELLPSSEQEWLLRREYVKTYDETYSQAAEGWLAENGNYYRLDEQGNWKEIPEEEYYEEWKPLETFSSAQDFINEYSLIHTPFGQSVLQGMTILRGHYPVNLDETIYVGESEIDGMPAVQYQGISVDATQQGIKHTLLEVEYPKDNPMLYRIRIYDIIPETLDLTLREQQRLTEIPVDSCMP